MPMYKQINNDTLILSQQAIYGSSRLGVLERDEIVSIDSSLHPQNVVIPDPLTENVTHWARGKKRYELTNHLGNVLATVNDRKLPVYQNGAFNYYKAEVMTANDYYAFGMAEPKRSFDTSDYRFGFGGHENIDEIHKANEWYAFGDYGYDPRIVQRPRTEPLASKYPYLSPYVSFRDNPIYLNDNNGKEPKSVVTYDPATGFYKFTKPAITLLSLVSGVSEERIAAVNIKRPNQVLISNSNGAMTAVDRIQYDNDYFNRANFYYGMDNTSSVYNWLDISSHEVRHLPQADKFGKTNGGKLAYFGSFLAEYAKEWIKDPGLDKGWDAHDKAHRELDAEKGSDVFKSFANHVNNEFGKNALQNLFLDEKKSDSYKIDKLKTWWNSYKSSGNGGSTPSPSQDSGGGAGSSSGSGSESKPSGGGGTPSVSVHCTYC